MKILFVTQWTDIYPSSRFRVYNLLPHLAQHGITYTVVPINNFRFRIQDKIISSNLKYFYKLVLLINNIVKWCVVLAKSLGGEYDILFIQKPIFNFNFYPVFEKILSKINKNIVFDMDDALQLTNKHIPTILKIAKATLVENQYNREYCLGYTKNVHIITNPIETNWIKYKFYEDKKYPIIIGWIGSLSTCKELLLLSDVFKKLHDTYWNKILLKTIGSKIYDKQELWNINLLQKDRVKDEEEDDILSFDIWIMPLVDTDWNRWKWGCKLLQYMSKWLAAVASNVWVNNEIIVDGESWFLANDKGDRFNHLSLLIENFTLREQIGYNAKTRVKNFYSVHHYIHTYIAIFKAISNGN